MLVIAASVGMKGKNAILELCIAENSARRCPEAGHHVSESIRVNSGRTAVLPGNTA